MRRVTARRVTARRVAVRGQVGCAHQWLCACEANYSVLVLQVLPHLPSSSRRASRGEQTSNVLELSLVVFHVEFSQFVPV